MKILHISDSHGFHNLLKLNLTNVDVVVHSGDSTNYFETYKNEIEFKSFLIWFSELPVKHKIYVAGNHDTFIYNHESEVAKLFSKHGITYLNKEYVIIEDIKFYGDPSQPKFGNWVFQHPRDSMDRHWKHIPKDTDILITHGPPEGILDIAKNKLGVLKQCGCNVLYNTIIHKLNIHAHLFGHVHNTISNQGIHYHNEIKFSNGSVTTDKYIKEPLYKYDGDLLQGNIINLTRLKLRQW